MHEEPYPSGTAFIHLSWSFFVISLMIPAVEIPIPFTSHAFLYGWQVLLLTIVSCVKNIKPGEFEYWIAALASIANLAMILSPIGRWYRKKRVTGAFGLLMGLGLVVSLIFFGVDEEIELGYYFWVCSFMVGAFGFSRLPAA